MTPEQQQAINELYEKRRKIAEQIAKVEGDAIKKQGEFLTSIEKKALIAQNELKLQQDILQAVQKRQDLERINNDLAFKNFQITEDIQKIGLELSKLDANAAEDKQRMADLEDRRVRLERQRSDNIRQSQDAEKRNLIEIKGLFEAQLEAIEENLDLSEEQTAELKRQTEEILQQIINGDLTVEQAREKLKELKKQTKEYNKQAEAVNGVADATAGLLGTGANLLGISTEFSGKMNEILTAFKEAGPGGVLQGMFKGFTEVFNLSNIIGSMIKGVFEFTKKIIDLQSEISAATGFGEDLAMSFLDVQTNINRSYDGISVLAEEAGEAFKELALNLPIFSSLSKGTRDELTKTALFADRLGIDIGDYADIISNLMMHTGVTVEGANKNFENLIGTMGTLGIPPKQAAQEFAKMSSELAYLGISGPKVFVELSKRAKALNTTVEETLGIVKKFNTFDDAIPSVNKLNVIMQRLSGSTSAAFNALDLVMQADPAKRIEMITDAFNSYGVSMEELTNLNSANAAANQAALRALTDAAGASSVADLIKQMSVYDSSLTKLIPKQKTLAEMVASAESPFSKLAVIAEELAKAVIEGLNEAFGGPEGLNEGLKSFASFIKESIKAITDFIKKHPDFVRNILLGAGAFGSLSSSVGEAGGAVSNFASTFLGSAMGSKFAAGGAKMGANFASGFMRFLGPLALAVGGVYAGYEAYQYGKEAYADAGVDSEIGGGISGAAGGAIAGAAIGSVVPVIGTGLGAVIGGLAGGAMGYMAADPNEGRRRSMSQAPLNYAGQLNDGIVTKDGNVYSIPPDDNLVTFKDGTSVAKSFVRGATGMGTSIDPDDLATAIVKGLESRMLPELRKSNELLAQAGGDTIIKMDSKVVASAVAPTVASKIAKKDRAIAFGGFRGMA